MELESAPQIKGECLTLTLEMLRVVTVIIKQQLVVLILIFSTILGNAFPPPNDDFSRRDQIVSLSFPNNGTNSDATSEANERGHGSQGFSQPKASVWYEWRPDVAGNATVSVNSFGIANHVFSIYTGFSFFSLDRVARGSGGFSGSPANFEVSNRETYYIAVDSASSGFGDLLTGSFSLQISLSSPPENDDFPLDSPAIFTNILPDTEFGTTVDATRQNREPSHAGRTGNGSVWYPLRLSASQPVQISVSFFRADPLVAVYTGSRVSELEVVPLTSGTGVGVSRSTTIEFFAERFETYYIAVDSQSLIDQGGEFQLEIRDIPQLSIYEQWLTRYPSLPPEQQSAEDDPDSDGFSNVFEMLFGTDPTTFSHMGQGGNTMNLPVLNISTSKTLNFSLAELPVGAGEAPNLIGEFSADLITWDPVPILSVISTRKFIRAPDSATIGYLRLKIAP